MKKDTDLRPNDISWAKHSRNSLLKKAGVNRKRRRTVKRRLKEKLRRINAE